jgi:hypothetical protein
MLYEITKYVIMYSFIHRRTFHFSLILEVTMTDVCQVTNTTLIHLFWGYLRVIYFKICSDITN